VLRDDDESMVELGIGKNMVRVLGLGSGNGVAKLDDSGSSVRQSLALAFLVQRVDQFLEDPERCGAPLATLCARR